ncbi:MAG TPA: thiamine-phosphate kinase [Thermoanaerobaculia bacterium]|jgi:thiamine-monophosphate kinase
MAGEDCFVRRLTAELPPDARVLVGPGDDAAVIAASPAPLVLTTDLLVEGVDFLPGEDPFAIGRRALAVNLSDLAAMGAVPEHFLLSIAFRAPRGEDYALAVARGALSRATPLGVALVGGDLSAADRTIVSIALAGRPAAAGSPILRSGGRAGDVLYLSGFPGRAAAGLAIERARAEARELPAGLSDAQARELVAAYRDPEPRLALGQSLAGSGLARAAIDVSDGLGLDAARLAGASDLRAVIEADRLPVSPALAAYARAAGKDAVEMLLAGGDDYELLFAVPRERAAEVPGTGSDGIPVVAVGWLEPGRGAVLRSAAGDRDVGGMGYDHLGGPSA